MPQIKRLNRHVSSKRVSELRRSGKYSMQEARNQAVWEGLVKAILANKDLSLETKDLLVDIVNYSYESKI